MKAGWKTRSLGELLLKTETVNPLSAPDDDFSYIDVSSVSNETYEIEETQRLKGKDAPSRARRLVKAGDVIFATIRPTLQRIARVPASLDGQVCSTGYFVMRPCPELDAQYLFYSLFTEQFMSGMESLQKGASYPAVTDAEVRSQQISYPSLQEQRRIVTLLDEAFADIAIAKANAEKNLQNARELFNSHLDAIVVHAQENGEIVALSELATDITDGDHMPPPKVEHGLPFITIGNIDKQTRSIDFADTFKVPREYFDGLKANKKPMRGDVLYTVTGSFGIPVLVEDDAEFCFQRHIGLIRPKADVDSTWLHYLLQSPQVFNQAADGATGTAQKTVSLKVLRNLQVPRIFPKDQLAHVETLRSVEAECRRLESIYRQKLTALDDLKKSLLHQAFSGQL
ncbi:restriction endonuclease subunit S [Limnohabitans sp.]|uniref:restriction endonuclease subunit S n=1 Tax=Limnohabitans sp. TaxID=1907725 RepID=UPI00334177A5